MGARVMTYNAFRQAGFGGLTSARSLRGMLETLRLLAHKKVPLAHKKVSNEAIIRWEIGNNTSCARAEVKTLDLQKGLEPEPDFFGRSVDPGTQFASAMVAAGKARVLGLQQGETAQGLVTEKGIPLIATRAFLSGVIEDAGTEMENTALHTSPFSRYW